MNLREALILQAPSLALLRAAADEIARLDWVVQQLREELRAAADEIARQDGLIQQLREELRELRKEKADEVQPQHPEQGVPARR